MGINIDELNEEEIEEIKNDGLNSLITLIKHLNFNDRLPENHTFVSGNTLSMGEVKGYN